MQSWDKWKEENKDNLKHIAGYEEMFVDVVLSQIPLISPQQVSAQYHFVDHRGKNRYIDFVIRVQQGESKEVSLPIELDGKTKFDTYESFNDTLERQNDLVKQFGILLRYSNKKMLNEPKSIIDEITQFIQQLRQEQDVAEMQHENLMEYQSSINEELVNIRQELDKKLEQVNEKLANLGQDEGLQAQVIAQQKQLTQQLTNLQNMLRSTYQQSHSSTSPLRNAPSEKRDTETGLYMMKGLISAPLLLLLFLLSATVYWFWNSKPLDNIQLKEPETAFILAQDASKYLSEFKRVCDQLVEVRPFDRGVFLNFVKPYPSQLISGIIWNEHIDQIGASFIKSLENKRVCIEGKIQGKNQKYQIEIKYSSQISKED